MHWKWVLCELCITVRICSHITSYVFFFISISWYFLLKLLYLYLWVSTYIIVFKFYSWTCIKNSINKWMNISLFLSWEARTFILTSKTLWKANTRDLKKETLFAKSTKGNCLEIQHSYSLQNHWCTTPFSLFYMLN